MPDKDSKKQIKKLALEFIKSNNTAVVATVSKKGEPGASMVYFNADDEFNFYFVIRTDSEKYKSVSENPIVAIVVGFGPDISTVQARGRVEEIKSSDYMEVLNKIESKGMNKWPIFSMKEGSFRAFKMIPDYLMWLHMEKDKYPEAYDNGFHVIIS